MVGDLGLVVQGKPGNAMRSDQKQVELPLSNDFASEGGNLGHHNSLSSLH